MYPYPRSSGRPAPAVSPPQSMSSRSTSQRDQMSDRSSDFDLLTFSDQLPEEPRYRQSSAESTKARAEHLKNHVLICRRFFCKNALVVASARVNLTPAKKRGSDEVEIDQWFNTYLAGSDKLSKDVINWRNWPMLEDPSPPPLTLEVYLDVSEITKTHTLVFTDDRGKRFDLCKALQKTSSGSEPRQTQIILERWRFELKDTGDGDGYDNYHSVYKMATVTTRAIYCLSRLLPASKLSRRLSKDRSTCSSLRPMYRITAGDAHLSVDTDLLALPLFPSSDPTTVKQMLPPTHDLLGTFFAEVTYRTQCDFHVVDTASLLSSNFRVMDELQFRPSLEKQNLDDYFNQKREVVGSAPVTKRVASTRPEMRAYGSMATNGRTNLGTSPLHTLQTGGQTVAQRMAASPSSTPPITREPPDHRVSISSKSSLKTINEGAPPVNRRFSSVSFQPFKNGALGSSPKTAVTPVNTTSEMSRALEQSRNRKSSTTLPQTALRIPPGANTSEVAVESPTESSPKESRPPVKYTSSFSNRKSRLSSGALPRPTSRDLTNSSLRSSHSSHHRRSSSAAVEDPSGSSTSLRTDDDSIADFLKLLDQKKELKSFSTVSPESRDASTRRTTAALTKFKNLRESHAALSESVTSSTMLHRSSSSSSRVPGLIPGSSLSSMSPGKPISPHTPAIPSRLSSAAIAEDFEESDRESDRGRRDSSPEPESQEEGASAAVPIPGSSRPIDVPMRRPRHRRSSSTANQPRQIFSGLDDKGMRSASVPVRERDPAATPAIQAILPTIVDGAAVRPASLDPAGVPIAESVSPGTTFDNPLAREADGMTSSRQSPLTVPPTHRPLSTRGTGTASRGISFASVSGHAGRGSSFLHSSEEVSGSAEVSGSGSHSGGGARPGSLGRRANRYSFGSGRLSGGGGGLGAADDDEPLLFTMSEIEAKKEDER